MGHEDLGSGAIADLEIDTDAAGEESTDSEDPAHHQADHAPGLGEDVVVVLMGRHDGPLRGISRASERMEKRESDRIPRERGGARARSLVLCYLDAANGARQGSFSASFSAHSLGGTRGMPSRSTSSNATSNPGASGSHAATIGRLAGPRPDEDAIPLSPPISRESALVEMRESAPPGRSTAITGWVWVAEENLRRTGQREGSERLRDGLEPLAEPGARLRLMRWVAGFWVRWAGGWSRELKFVPSTIKHHSKHANGPLLGFIGQEKKKEKLAPERLGGFPPKRVVSSRGEA